jgi:steroid 5-alpha reductase family enzyme
MLEALITALIVSFAINISMFLVAFKLKSDKLTDISYAVTFITVALYGLLQSDAALGHIMLAGMVFVWALRLGGFLLYRVIKNGKDSRFDDMRGNFVKFGKFWMAQALTVWVLMIHSILAFNADLTWNKVLLVGFIVWAAGFLLEATADLQKMRFTQKNTWIESGVWNYSRHPNYFGEILVWFGIYLYIVPNLNLGQIVVGAISPLFIATLLLFVSGIPILEKSADKKWGKLRGYQEYKRRTSILIPLPKRP